MCVHIYNRIKKLNNIYFTHIVMRTMYIFSNRNPMDIGIQILSLRKLTGMNRIKLKEGYMGTKKTEKRNIMLFFCGKTVLCS